MPTYNRRQFIPNAIQYFLNQDYPNKELIIVDDGDDCIEDLVPKRSGIHYIRTKKFATLGEKRNFCIQNANGNLIMHWDDDDWMASYRISYQLRELLKHKAEVCGIQNIYYQNLETKECWLYNYPKTSKPWLAGGSLLYDKKFWKKFPFPNIQVASDTIFMFSRTLTSYCVLENFDFYIATIHSQNTSPKKTSTSIWLKVDKSKLDFIIQQNRLYSEKELTSNKNFYSNKSNINMNPITKGTLNKNIAILVTTYKRPNMLKGLLDSLKQESNKYSIDYYIFDDEVAKNGKKKYWKSINSLWQQVKNKSYDYYFQLPDDFSLKQNFIQKSIDAWESISDSKKICLNIFCDDSRIGKTNWTNFHPEIHYFNDKRYFKTQWTDLAHICESTFFEKLAWNIDPIPMQRWKNNPNLSSGVGQQISTKLNSLNFNMYQVTQTLTEHISNESMMNPDERKKTPLKSAILPKIYGGMASIPNRENELKKTINSLLPYFDKIFLYLNDYDVIPNWVTKLNKLVPFLSKIEQSNMGDAGKFYMLDKIESTDFYYFSLDDDCIYPDNYVWRMIEKIEFYERNKIITAGGYTMKNKVQQFYKDRNQSWHISLVNETDRPVQIPHTAFTAWHSSSLDFKYEFCKKPNMGDLWLGLEAQKQDIPIVLLNRKSNWIKVQEIPNSKTIYHKHRNHCVEQTNIYNSYKNWRIIPIYN